MRPAIAFDVSGVFIKSGRPIPRAAETLHLLKQFQIPFVFLTNAGGRLESDRAKIFNKIINTDVLNEKNVIQAHTPMKMIYHEMKAEKLLREESTLCLVGGSEQSHLICDSYGFTNYITVQELAATHPILVPLTQKSGYPQNPKELQQRVQERLRIRNLDELLKRRIQAIMLFSNPFMYETHLQILSDALIAKEGILGTIRGINEKQYPRVFFAHTDLTIPFSEPEMPALTNRFSLGAFTRSLQEIFTRQYKNYAIDYSITGKPSKHAFDYASNFQYRLIQYFLGAALKTQTQGGQGELELYMVGDSPKSDIKGGNANGFKTILVQTGNYQSGMDTGTPTHIADDVYEAVNLIVKKHYYD